MHKETIAVYDRSARRWADTRKAPDTSIDRANIGAARLRALAGAGCVLDLGCGPGHLFASLGSPTIGVDASLGMLALADNRTTVPLIAADLEQLPFRAAFAAAAFANFSLQHLTKAGLARALAEARRVLAPRGHLQLAVHAGDYEGDDRPGDDLPGRWFTMWTPERLHPELAHAGFTVVDAVAEGGSLRVTAQRS